MYKGAWEAIMEYGDYLFSEEETYSRMYGGTKSPSLLPKYAIDYIVHKQAIRKLFLDGFGSFIFDMKKVVFPPLHLYVRIYKFSKLKGAPNFVNDLEIFYFG